MHDRLQYTERVYGEAKVLSKVMVRALDEKPYTQAKEYFWELVRDDYTQLGYLSGFLRRQLPDEPDEEILKLTQAIVKELMESKGVYVVNPKTEQPSERASGEVMAEIGDIFRELDGVPDVGDGMWFGVDVS